MRHFLPHIYQVIKQGKVLETTYKPYYMAPSEFRRLMIIKYGVITLKVVRDAS